MTSQLAFTKRGIWVDLDQGETEDGRRFGYVGQEGRRGWFFRWPTGVDADTCLTDEQRSELFDSLELDETDMLLPPIELRDAELALKAKLGDFDQ